jgi:hypothetical protein
MASSFIWMICTMSDWNCCSFSSGEDFWNWSAYYIYITSLLPLCPSTEQNKYTPFTDGWFVPTQKFIGKISPLVLLEKLRTWKFYRWTDIQMDDKCSEGLIQAFSKEWNITFWLRTWILCKGTLFSCDPKHHRCGILQEKKIVKIRAVVMKMTLPPLRGVTKLHNV